MQDVTSIVAFNFSFIQGINFIGDYYSDYFMSSFSNGHTIYTSFIMYNNLTAPYDPFPDLFYPLPQNVSMTPFPFQNYIPQYSQSCTSYPYIFYSNQILKVVCDYTGCRTVLLHAIANPTGETIFMVSCLRDLTQSACLIYFSNNGYVYTLDVLTENVKLVADINQVYNSTASNCQISYYYSLYPYPKSFLTSSSVIFTSSTGSCTCNYLTGVCKSGTSMNSRNVLGVVNSFITYFNQSNYLMLQSVSSGNIYSFPVFSSQATIYNGYAFYEPTNGTYTFGINYSQNSTSYSQTLFCYFTNVTYIDCFRSFNPAFTNSTKAVYAYSDIISTGFTQNGNVVFSVTQEGLSDLLDFFAIPINDFVYGTANFSNFSLGGNETFFLTSGEYLISSSSDYYGGLTVFSVFDIFSNSTIGLLNVIYSGDPIPFVAPITTTITTTATVTSTMTTTATTTVTATPTSVICPTTAATQTQIATTCATQTQTQTQTITTCATATATATATENPQGCINYSLFADCVAGCDPKYNRGLATCDDLKCDAYCTNRQHCITSAYINSCEKKSAYISGNCDVVCGNGNMTGTLSWLSLLSLSFAVFLISLFFH